MYAYCLFCETQKCGFIAYFIEKELKHRCISPRIIQRKWIKGKAREEYHDWLPGYVFVYTDEPIIPRFPVDGIIRCLGNGELTGQDRVFADMLYQQNGIIGTIRLAEVGDRCHVADPLWENMQGTIIKLDRGRKRCCVEFEFDKIKRTVWVGFDLVKTENNQAVQQNQTI